MKQTIKTKWLKFLKGKRKARNKLSSGSFNAKCCLDHLCELYRQETNKGKWIKFSDYQTFEINEHDGSENTLPRAVAKWSGLSHDQQDYLAKLNDNKPGFPISAIKKL